MKLLGVSQLIIPLLCAALATGLCLGLTVGAVMAQSLRATLALAAATIIGLAACTTLLIGIVRRSAAIAAQARARRDGLVKFQLTASENGTEL